MIHKSGYWVGCLCFSVISKRCSTMKWSLLCKGFKVSRPRTSATFVLGKSSGVTFFAVINLRETLPDFTAYIFIKERDLKDLKIAFLEIVLEICQFLTDFGFVLTHLLYLRFFFFFLNAFSTCPSRKIKECGKRPSSFLFLL